jgi:hypothetical protein
MQIDRSDEHLSKTGLPRIESIEPDSNVKCERPSHDLKQKSSIVPTDAGTQIDRSAEQVSNIHFPKSEILEPASNLNEKAE